MQLDRQTSHGGAQSLRLASNGPSVRVTSEPFTPPATGRLTLGVWLRVADVMRQPPLRLALEGPMEGGRQYVSYAMLGAAPAINSITAQWAEYRCNFDDLPLEGLGPLRVWLELSGPGDVWIDDAQLFHLYFTDNERVELTKLIALADVKLQNGQISDCIYLLQGYWPRFLETNVPLTPGSLDRDRLRRPKLAARRRFAGFQIRSSGSAERNVARFQRPVSPARWQLSAVRWDGTALTRRPGPRVACPGAGDGRGFSAPRSAFPSSGPRNGLRVSVTRPGGPPKSPPCVTRVRNNPCWKNSFAKNFTIRSRIARFCIT